MNRLTAALLLAVLALACAPAHAQNASLTGDVGAHAEVWADPADCFQNAFDADGRASLDVGPFFADAFVRFRWWGSCDAKIAGSILNAEAGRVVERWHGIDVGATWRSVEAGVTVRRDAVHVIHRFKNRNGWGFPAENSARWAKEQCRAGNDGNCPFIGYYDGVGPFIGVETDDVFIRITGPQYRWKDLTLPWPAWTLRSRFEFGRLAVGANGQTGGIKETAFDLFASYAVAAPVRLGLRYGHLDRPGWKRSPLKRFAVMVALRN